MRGRILPFLACLMLLPAFAAAQEWPRFRGPDGLGRAPDCDPPVTWSETENIAWKTPLPGAGVSSPIVIGDKIILTCYSGVDRWDEKQRSSRENMMQIVTCLNTSGRILWSTEVEPAEKMPSSRVIRWHGYASHTPVSDGEKIYAFFGTTGVVALDMEGNILWRFKDVGTGTHSFGTAASPVLVDDKLIVPAGMESRTLIALNKDTGEVIWRQKDDGGLWSGFRWGFSTPVVAEVDGRKQLIMGIMNAVAGFDAQNGQMIWEAYYMEKGKGHSYPSSSPIVMDGVAYFSIANSHRANDTLAIKLSGAKSDITESKDHLLWHTRHGGYVGGPVYHKGRLYFAHFGNNSNKRLQGFFCLDAKTGKVVFEKKRNDMDNAPSLIYASGLLAGGRIYIPAVSDGTYVLEAGTQYNLLAHNKIADDETAFSASPVPLGNDRMLLRSDKYLYCIGE